MTKTRAIAYFLDPSNDSLADRRPVRRACGDYPAPAPAAPPGDAAASRRQRQRA